jgi:hypothetical protein
MKARSLLPVLAFAPLALAAQDNDPPSRAGRVSSVAGTVAFQAGGTPDWTIAPLNYTVTSGDRILTHRQSRAEIEVGPFDVRLADSTDLSVVNLTDDFAQLGLARGTLRVTVYRLASRDSLEVDTPNGALIIRTAGKYRVDVLEGVSTIVSVEEGVVELSGPSLDYTVKRGQSIELTGTSAISASMVPHPRNTEFDSWSFDRDRLQQQSTHSTYMSQDIPGGAELDRYGHWQYHVTYGYVWRPRLVTVGWVPYRHGRWVWTGPWGWSWVEDAPWGYAPFHYGRWVVVGGVWAWAPGPIIRRPCYAPALVVFIGGPRHHQAWFPLGWHEPYYPRYRHSDRYLRQVNIANVRNISNVDDFIDPRRADRVGYSNRQATTVVSSDVFGRRPVANDVANIRRDEIDRAPIVRDRWDGPRTGTMTTTPRTATTPATVERPSSPFRERRDFVTPSREAPSPRETEPPRVDAPAGFPEAPRVRPEPRAESPLIFRNSPPSVGRDRPSVRRAEAASPPEATQPPQGVQPPDRSRRWMIERAPRTPQAAEPERVSPPPRASTPSRESNPWESSPRASTPSRESSPRESSPRASSPPRETGSRESRIRPPEPRSSASAAPPAASREARRRPPT